MHRPTFDRKEHRRVEKPNAARRKRNLNEAATVPAFRLTSGVRPSASFLLLFIVAAAAHAQDGLRLWLGHWGTASARRLELGNQPYAVRWGDLKVLASVSVDSEWNDNVNLVHTDPKQDFIFRPLAKFGLFWPVTELNALTFSVGAGYAKFVQHEQYDQFLITPGSALGWDIFLTNLRINFHDQFSYEQDPTTWGAIP
jgi:hypothetical protein